MVKEDDIMAKKPAPLKAKRKKRTRGLVTQKMVCFRCDEDLMPFLNTKTNKGRYINTLIRKDREEEWGLKGE